ncbi:hypothetical protein F5Y16DRAFT_361865 [Xylariaceae sp. FL0255]|nr:hypothetical protein F5Y16DRAFT_361865 [Xylariaceae sp. FL0255]
MSGTNPLCTPGTRQRIHKEPPPLTVPDINADAAERKRVLNVLAQRRYRERKRQAKDRGRAKPHQSTLECHDVQNVAPLEPSDPAPPLPKEQNVLSTELSSEDLASFDLSALDIMDFMATSNAQSWSLVPLAVNQTCQSESSDSPSPNPMLSTGDTSLSVIEGGMNLATASGLPSSPSSFSSRGSNSTDSSFSFPDSYYLPMSELTLLRALLRIATRLRCNTKTMWEIEASSPFNDGTHTPSTMLELPLNWRPTQAQITVPHHPAIDMLPWPNVRDRIIQFMNLPDDARPAVATGPLAIVQFAYDLEDTAEGVRIWGDDPCEATSWEVGQALFERWWFIFDKQVIDQSNYWRTLRGAPALLNTKRGP